MNFTNRSGIFFENLVKSSISALYHCFGTLLLLKKRLNFGENITFHHSVFLLKVTEMAQVLPVLVVVANKEDIGSLHDMLANHWSCNSRKAAARSGWVSIRFSCSGSSPNRETSHSASSSLPMSFQSPWSTAQRRPHCQ